MLDTTDDWYTNMDYVLWVNKCINAIILFIDLKKALDTTDHDNFVREFNLL